MHCWKLITGSSEPEKLLEITLQVLQKAVYQLYTQCIHWCTGRKCTGGSKFKILVCSSEDMLLEGNFQLSKVEKQADIQPVYTDIHRHYTLNMCKKCELQVNVQGRQFQMKYGNRDAKAQMNEFGQSSPSSNIILSLFICLN